jgi:hypothetical protein
MSKKQIETRVSQDALSFTSTELLLIKELVQYEKQSNQKNLKKIDTDHLCIPKMTLINNIARVNHIISKINNQLRLPY